MCFDKKKDLYNDLSSNDCSLRRKAIISLKEFVDNETIKKIEKLFNDEDTSVRYFAKKIVKEIREKLDINSASSIQGKSVSSNIDENVSILKSKFNENLNPDQLVNPITTNSNDPNFAQEQFNLGNIYYMGEGVPQDDEKAIHFFEKAALAGNAYAQFYLGDMYESGRGVPQNYQKAAEWYEKAASQGNALAQNSLGTLYESGNGLTKNYQKALNWFMKAAVQGFAEGQFNLGNMYYKGEGVSKDDKKAIAWFMKAASQDFVKAQHILRDMHQEEPQNEKIPEHKTHASEPSMVAKIIGTIFYLYLVGSIILVVFYNMSMIGPVVLRLRKGSLSEHIKVTFEAFKWPYLLYINYLSDSNSKTLQSPSADYNIQDIYKSQIKNYIINNYRCPDSYESINWSELEGLTEQKFSNLNSTLFMTSKSEGLDNTKIISYAVGHKYKYKSNDYGQIIEKSEMFWLDLKGEIVNTLLINDNSGYQ